MNVIKGLVKNDVYKINNIVEKVLSGRATNFLDQREFKLVTSKLKKKNYNIYSPYKTSEKVILYTNELPMVSLYKINTYEKLRHQDILGSILGLNILSSYVGDIIIEGDNYYFYIISDMDGFIKDNLNVIGNKHVSIEKINLDTLKDYERKYAEYEVVVSSLRIDNVISRIINTNRKLVCDKVKNKEIIINYEVLTRNSYVLKEDDVFSIRSYGKYKFIGVVNSTKKNNLVIKYLKYL